VNKWVWDRLICMGSSPLQRWTLFYFNIGMVWLLLWSHWAQTGWINVASTSEKNNPYVMTLNQSGKLIWFAKSHQSKGILRIWSFFSPNFEPKSHDMVPIIVDFTLNSH
jgi:hypothetical protein